MCGKFTQMMAWGTLVYLADLIGAAGGPAETVTPMRFANVIRQKGGKRESARMRWGFVPQWEKDPIKGSKFIHARAESLDVRPAFMDAFANRRGLLIVRTFNEGKEIAHAKTEQHVVAPNDGKPIAIAVIWQSWGEAHAGGIDTFAMVTTAANALIGTITDRMPAIVTPGNWDKWLGETSAHPEELKAMLTPYEGDWHMQPEKAKQQAAATPTPPLPGLF